MNREDIIRMAKQAGFERLGHDEHDYVCYPDELEAFAALVASAEREACAKIVESDPSYDWHKFACEAANAIRARGNVATNDTSQERVDKTSENVHDPVAWISATELLVMRGNALGGANDWRVNLGLEPEEGDVGLYTTPPQRKPLTDEEIGTIAKEHIAIGTRSFEEFARRIEAAHGIKGEV